MASRFASLRLASECGATLRLALPLVLGQLAAVAMNVVDTVLAGRHGALTLAGVAVGSAMWSLVILVLIGVLMAVPPSVSQLNGADRRSEIGPLFRQALWLALGLGLGLFIATRFSAPLLPLMGIAADVQPGAMDFLRAIAWGAPAMALVFAFRYTSEGLGITRPTMVFGIGTLLLLIPLGYWLMNGGLGLPGYGAAGLGAATAIVLWAQALGFGLWLRFGPRYRDLQLFAGFERPNPRLLGQLLRLGLPLGVSVLMEGTLFVASALIIGSMGAVAVAAHQIAINVASVLFMVPLGVAMATTVRVGFAAGGRDHEGVRRACAAGFAITAVTQLVSAALLVLLPGPIASLYTDEAVVLAAVPPLLMLAALFQISDGLQVAAAGALRGLKDTRLPMLITAFAYWGVGMPLGALFAFPYAWGAPGMWVGLVLGLTVAAILLGWRLRHLLRARVFAAQ